MTKDGNGTNGVNLEALANIVGSAKGVAFLNLVKQIKSGKKLTAHDLELLNEIETKMQPEGEKSEPAKAQGLDQVFDNALEVMEYLKAEGWKISKSSIYAHIKKALLRPDVGGKKFSLKAVLLYAKTHLVTENTRQKIKAEDLQSKKAAKELEKLDEEIKKLRFKRGIDEGKYILRDDFYLELAGRGAVLETIFKGMIQARAGELVALVEGNETKVGDLVRELMSETDKALTEFANIKEFQVLFEEE